MPRIGVAVIGCGNMGRTHSDRLSRMPRVSLRAFADVRAEAASIFASKYGAKYYTTDVDRVMKDPEVEAVFICTWHDSHPILAIKAAEAGKDIFIEKPLALTIEACKEIEKAVEAAGVLLVVGFMARFSPFVQRIKQMIPKPIVTVGQLIDPKWSDKSWAVTPDKGGGNVLSQGCHTFDLVYYLNQSEPVSIHAEGGTFTHENTEVIDSVVATVRFENHAVANFIIGDFGPSPYTGKEYVEVFDGKGKSATLYHYYDEYAGVKFAGVKPSDLTIKDLPEEYGAEEVWGRSMGYLGFTPMLNEFIDCIINDKKPPTAALVKDGTRATTLAIKAFESVRTGETQKIHL